MTFLELQQETHRLLREADCGGIYFSTEDIREAINAGYMELSDSAEWLEESLEIELLKSRPYYDLFTLITCGFLSIKPALDENRHRWLLPSTVRGLDGNDRRWERVVGTPQRIFLRGLRWLGLYPRTNADGDRLKVYYTRLPEPLCADTDEPQFPEAYHMGCVYFALADLFAEDGETKLALDAWTDYLAMEAGLQRWVDGRMDRPITRVFGAVTRPI